VETKRTKLGVWWDRYNAYVKSAGLAVVGALAVLLFKPKAPLENPFLEHLAMAVAVAGVIAFFIELTLQKRFADNVFKAAVGYLLREDLREELTWIYEQKILCTELVAHVVLEHLQEDGLVKVTCSLQRTLENISMKGEPVVLKGGADEWFVENRPSKVTQATYRKLDDSARTNLVVKESSDGIWWDASEEVKLAPGEQLDFTITFEQWHRENDTLLLTYRYPIKNPRVTVACGPTLIPRVLFDHRAKYEGDWETATGTWHPRVVLLPHQDIRVKWHRRDLVQARAKSLGE
jgi:hypothetical protein